MTEDRERRRRIGRVGRPHGLDGAFRIDGAEHPLARGMIVSLGGRELTVERRAGTAERPVVRLQGVGDRDAAEALRGLELSVSLDDVPLEAGEWLADDLVGCRIDGVGEVRRVVRAPSCDLLEAGPGGVLIPFLRDAIRAVDVARRHIEVDRRFLALDDEEPGGGRASPPGPVADADADADPSG